MVTITHPVLFTVRFPTPETHYFRVSLAFENVDAEEIELTLPAWIPGSYMIRDFARNIEKLSAKVDGSPTILTRVDKQTWRLPRAIGKVVVEYAVYARDFSVRGAHLDDSHAYFNGSSLFLRICSSERQEHQLTIIRPNHKACTHWRVATSMPILCVDTAGFGRYRAESYEAFIDYPVEIGGFSETVFDVDSIPHRMIFSGRHDSDLARIGRDIAKICSVHADLYGLPLPVDRYLFMTSVVGDGYGGLEHRDSTSLLISRGELPRRGGNGKAEIGVSEGYRRFLGLCSHEYFHLWNVKRIRPARLAEADLGAESYTTLLWAFEGITSYYDDLALVRAGVIDEVSYLELLAQNITRLMRTAGRHKQSVAESSFYAWTKFYKQDENATNAIVSYYNKGALVSLGLDVTLRDVTSDRVGLDDLMRALWEEYGKPGIGVPEDGIEGLAAELAGQDLSGFFKDFVHGTVELPLREWLSRLGIGLRLRPAATSKDNGGVGDPSQDPAPAKAVLGATFLAGDGGAKLTRIFESGAAQNAGLSVEDVIVAVDGLKVSSDSLADQIAALPLGAQMEIHVFRRDELRVFTLQPLAAPDDTCDLWFSPIEDLDDKVLARRKAWLGVGAS